ncbi:MAG: DUF692 family protein [Planctomycetota bacterium]
MDGNFLDRVKALPRLGLGISTEYDARRDGLDPNAFRRDRPDLLQFLEIGADLERGLDDDAREWIASGAPTTYHFLDVNLEEGDDIEEAWIARMREVLAEVRPAWVCGDAGLWYVGARDRGHGTLMPPIFSPESAAEMARGVRRLREGLDHEVLPENPPAHVYLGEMHLLDYFGRVLEDADTGMLLDVAHLAVYQRVMGHGALDGLADFPLERVVEVHVAGGSTFEHGGRVFVDDDHGVEVLRETWEIFELVLERASNLKAVVLECEHNAREAVLPLFERVAADLARRESRA